MNLYIYNFKLGEIPLIAGVLTDTDVLTINKNTLNPADLIELRIDMFEDTSLSHIENTFKIAKENFKKPIIATVRDVKEGGQKKITDRLSIYKAIIMFSDILDVEIGDENTMTEVKNICKIYKKLLIGSYHNFEFTPDDDFLDSIVLRGKELDADIVKIAVMAKDKEDLIKLTLFTHRHKEKGIITMSMGDKGLPSRVFNPVFGSLITYGYINHPSAPGQLSVSELLYIFRRLKIR
ncbi:3-dehydroquinate dehydratase [Dissulfurispira thermophila]|uniref:3-dehydroquinate dehydratase n=2 Tax=root TaxID=1 RepID=A0A7G1H2Y2_9BACT|nr:type I 3-dehydroquinate dehydratase [Dissulfurispira thermophila]BCB97164.1 3-dehydroquinate dehydratase [Dissulfurispira thermophila]